MPDTNGPPLWRYAPLVHRSVATELGVVWG